MAVIEALRAQSAADTGSEPAAKRILEGHSREVTSLVALADGRAASGSYDGTVRIWNVSTREREQPHARKQCGSVVTLEAAVHGRVASRFNLGITYNWDPLTGELIDHNGNPKNTPLPRGGLPLPQPRLPAPSARSNWRGSAADVVRAGSSLVGPGFATTYVDAEVRHVLPVVHIRNSQEQVVVASTLTHALHFFVVCPPSAG